MAITHVRRSRYIKSGIGTLTRRADGAIPQCIEQADVVPAEVVQAAKGVFRTHGAHLAALTDQQSFRVHPVEPRKLRLVE